MRRDIGPVISENMVTILTRSGDDLNNEVKQILEEKNLAYQEIDIEKENERKYQEVLTNYTGCKNYPFIYFGVRPIDVKELK